MRALRNDRPGGLSYIVALLCAAQAGATTIVIIRTPQEVVIAADSAATIRGDGLPLTTQTVCKIYQIDSGRMFFAVSGLVNDPRTGFSIPKIVAAESRDGGSMAAKLAAVEREVQAAALRELPHVKERDPAQYAKLIDSKGAVTVVFAGIDAGVPAAAGFSLGFTASPNGTIEPSTIRDSCPGNCPSGNRAFWFGDGDAIERLRATGKLPELVMPELARYLVQVEIDAGAPDVGGPIDVLRILPAGPVWLQKKPGCPVTLMTDGAK
jgi:Proteasome subunit